MGTTTETDDILDVVDELWALIGEHKRTEIDPSIRDEPFPYNETFMIEDDSEEALGSVAQTCKESGSEEIPESDRASTSGAASTQFEESGGMLPFALASDAGRPSVARGASATGGPSATREDSATEVPSATKKPSAKRRASATGEPSATKGLLATGRPSATRRASVTEGLLTSGGESETERPFSLGRTLATLRAAMSNEESEKMTSDESTTFSGASTSALPSSSGGSSISGEASATRGSLVADRILNTGEPSTLDVAPAFGTSTLGGASTSRATLMSGWASVAGGTTTSAVASTSREPPGGPSTSSAALMSVMPPASGRASTLAAASATSGPLMSGWALIPEESLTLSMASMSGEASTSGGTLDWVSISEEVLMPSRASGRASSGEALMQGGEPISRASTPDRLSTSDEASVTDRASTPEEMLAPGALTPTNGPRIQRHRTLTVVQRNRHSSSFNSVQVAFDRF